MISIIIIFVFELTKKKKRKNRRNVMLSQKKSFLAYILHVYNQSWSVLIWLTKNKAKNTYIINLFFNDRRCSKPWQQRFLGFGFLLLLRGRVWGPLCTGHHQIAYIQNTITLNVNTSFNAFMICCIFRYSEYVMHWLYASYFWKCHSKLWLYDTHLMYLKHTA